MARGTNAKKDTVRGSMYSPKVIDTSIQFKISRSTHQFDSNKHKFKCSCCGKGFTSQTRNFQRTNSVLFQSNDGCLPWCTECTDKYMLQLTGFYSNNEEHAIEHFCRQVDWTYDIRPLECSHEYSSHRSRISNYAAKKNINVDERKTYFDTLRYDFEQKLGEIITSKEDIKSGDISTKGVTIDRWGTGLIEWDYQILEDHYKMLKKNNPNADNNAEIFIKSLCNLNWLQAKMLRSENPDTTKYATLVEQYSKTFKQAGLRTVEEKDNSSDECLGVTLATISQYTPEEYYKDKSLYKDFDNIGDYFDRFVKRPLKNLMLGSNERDKEYCVKDTSDIDE